MKHIGEIGTNIAPSEGDLPRDCPLGNDVFQPRSFAPITYTWTASALCHKPLYFEDVQLERYGHMAGPWLQPFASGVNFFLTIPILPYKMGLETPNECMYTLGYYRPGDCAPYLFDPFPLSVRGAFFEAGAWVGAVRRFSVKRGAGSWGRLPTCPEAARQPAPQAAQGVRRHNRRRGPAVGVSCGAGVSPAAEHVLFPLKLFAEQFDP